MYSFWKSISYFIVTLTGNLLKLTPAMALLGINLDKYPSVYRTIIVHVLISARLNITSLWKSNDAPNLWNVIARVNIQAQYALLLAHKNYSITTLRPGSHLCELDVGFSTSNSHSRRM